jgi:hypothetical protein
MSERRPAGERGQALAITVLSLVVMVGMAGLVIDVGSWYVKHRQAQSAADFGALAAAAELPGSPANAVISGADYVDKNLAAATPAVTPGFAGDARKAEVKVDTEADTFFLQIFGWDSVTVSARAVAKRIAGGVPLAIFAYEQDCTALGIRLNGDEMAIEGGLHSNGAFSVNGNNNWGASATSGGPNACKPIVNGANNSFGGEPGPVEDTTFHEWPVYYTQSQFACDYTAEEFKFNQSDFVIPSGVYCASKLFSANGNVQSGKITVLAPEIVVNGNKQSFEPYAEGLLFFATGTKELILDGNAYDWKGVIFHPNGRVKINGNELSIFAGLIEGLTVEVNGNGFNMTGTGETTFDFISLVE